MAVYTLARPEVGGRKCQRTKMPMWQEEDEGIWGSMVSSPSGVQGGALAANTLIVKNCNCIFVHDESHRI